MKWGHLCFMIEEKMFFIIAIDEDNSFSIKCDPEEFDALTARAGIQQAHHMAKRQWIRVANLEVFNDSELKSRVEASRAMVLAKLSKKVQAKYV
ncbi:hypothetical protein OC25_20165 [Pedobacter kyungheensis]|uniref:MmcQ-like protein n=2 Tax=Pedobacter kyungheensis TaxID=1069985 RepID=A0A0C1DCK7_9SPHI|nr:hypothetical protein OC25_20165 [Pedobacter kyungheensis]